MVCLLQQSYPTGLRRVRPHLPSGVILAWDTNRKFWKSNVLLLVLNLILLLLLIPYWSHSLKNLFPLFRGCIFRGCFPYNCCVVVCLEVRDCSQPPAAEILAVKMFYFPSEKCLFHDFSNLA